MTTIPKKAFFFLNSYLSGIQRGIQAGHCSDEIWLKYVETGGSNPSLGA